MAIFKLITFVSMALVFVEAESSHIKRETISNLCDHVYKHKNRIQCYCIQDSKDDSIIHSAHCFPVKAETTSDDPNWDNFSDLKNVTKLIFTGTKAIRFNYIPKNGLKYTTSLKTLEVKNGNIETIEPFAFANLTLIKKIVLKKNHIKVLKPNAFAHHSNLKYISLDMNTVEEINRDVFIDLPALLKLHLTSNNITTIHRKAFMHLTNLRKLTINRNNIFSLNNETFSGLENLDILDISSNKLEFIGKDTFLPLKQLRVLNLDQNKIQTIDGKAFNGLQSLLFLSLSHNVLTDIDNEKTFEGLLSLKSLSLQGNKLRYLKPEVIAPLLQNLHSNESSLHFEDNNFLCDCKLDWFIPLKNHTNSSQIKFALEYLQCTSDLDIKEKRVKAAESEKTQETEEINEEFTDYGYYDDTLNDKLFYFDIRYLLNCTDKFDTKPIDNRTTTFKSTRRKRQIKYDKTVNAKVVASNPKLATTTPKAIANIEVNHHKHGIYTKNRLAKYSVNPLLNTIFNDNEILNLLIVDGEAIRGLSGGQARLNI